MKKSFLFLAFFGLFSVAVLARDALLTKGIEVYISRKMASQGWNFEDIQREKNTLKIKNISYQNPSGKILIEQADSSFHLSLFPLQLQPTVSVSHLSVEVTPNQSSDDLFIGLLCYLEDSRLDLKLSIDEGRVSGVLEEPFIFSFKSGFEKRDLGTLSIQNSEKNVFLSTHLKWEGEALISQVLIEKGKTSDLMALTSFMQNKEFKGWNQGQGEISASIKSRFHPKKGLEEMDGIIDLKEISFSHPILGIHLLSQSLKGTLFFSSEGEKDENLSFWRKAELFLTFENTSLSIDQKEMQLGVKEVLGELRITPKEDPYLKLGGKILSENLLIPFEIEGKGQLSEKGNYWLQTQADFFLAKRSSHIEVLFSCNENKETSLQLECANFSKEVFNILQLAFPLFEIPKCHMQSGEFGGKFVGSFEKGVPKILTFSECNFEGFDFAFPSKNLLMKSQNISFSGVLEKTKQGFLEMNSLEAEIRKLDLSFENKEICQSLSAKLGVHLGEFTPSSYVEGYHQKIWGSVQVLDPMSKDLFHIECKAFASNLIEKISNKPVAQSQASPIFLALDISSQEKKSFGSALVRFTSPSGLEEDIELQLSLDRTISRNVRDLFSGWDLSSYQGFFKTDRLSLETGRSWVRPWIGALVLDGFLKGTGQFNGTGFSFDISKATFSLLEGPWDLKAELGADEKAVHVAYEYKEGLWKGTIPVDFLQLKNSQLKIEADVQDSLFFFEGDKLWTDHFQANTLGSKFLGKLIMDGSGVQITSKSFGGTLRSLNSLMAQYVPQFSYEPIEGMFFIEESGCLVKGKNLGGQWSWDWKAAVNLKELAYDFGKMGRVYQGSVSLEGNAAGSFKFKGLQGIYSLAKESCPFALSDIHWDSHSTTPIDFSFLAKDGKREWVYLQGKAEKQSSGVVVSLSPYSHLLGLVMEVSPFMINSNLAISPIQISSLIKLEQMTSYLTMWKEMGLSNMNPSLSDAYRGTLHLQARYDVQKSSWKTSFQSSEISYLQKTLGKASGVITGEGRALKIESFQVGPWSLKGSIDALATEWTSPSLLMEWPEGKCLIKGKYTPSSGRLQIPDFSAALMFEKTGNVQLQGSYEGIYKLESSSLQGKGVARVTAALPASFDMGINSVKDVAFVFDSKKGVQIEKTQWDLTTLSSNSSNKKKIGKVTAKTMTYLMEEKRLAVQSYSLNLPKESYKLLQSLAAFSELLKTVQIDQEIDIQGDLDFSVQHRKISGNVRNGIYTIQGVPLDVKQMKFLYEQDDFYVSCQTKCQEEPLLVQLQMKFGKSSSACLLVKDHPEKKGVAIQLKKSLKEGWVCETVQGSLKGITLQVKKESEKNIYDLQIKADLSQVQTLLPKELSANMKKWGLGQGYAFQGVLTLDSDRPFHIHSLKGDLSGEGFGFLGKTLDLFSAKLDFSADRGRIHSLKLEDDLANLSIKTIDLVFNSKIQSWDIISPLVYVKDFAPSLLLKGSKERGVEINNLSIYDLKGSLNSLESFEAKGALYFSSKAKKEFSFWDVPLGMMKDWGLDPGLLTPVTGEADFTLCRGSFYFTALRNVYSDGKRSQFYLVEAADEAYLSLDGTWHVDLSMKQNVVWKVTEDLVLSIRGTVESPKYSFKSNKKNR